MKNKVLQRPMFMSPDEVENVGIMQGFMDDMGDVFNEEDETSDEDYETGKMMGRTPDSPEILMNNLRGDMRSVDARVEELADMVGYRAAAETPMEVLALLQPVLAGQGIASLPMGAPGQGAPGQAMPPVPPPMAPDMQMAGAPPAMPAMPEGGIASLPQGQPDSMQAPMAMAKGGIVQHFQDGSGRDGVTPGNVNPSTGDFRQESRDESVNLLLDILRQKPREVPSLQESMESRLPEYQAILGGGDKDAMRASMLFDIAQAALGYAGNVGPQGQPLRGSQAARLAGAVSALPGQIGARLGAQQQQEQAVRLAALQAGEKQIESIRAANTALAGEQRSIAQALAKEPAAGKFSRPLTPEELASPTYSRLDPSQFWMIDEKGDLSIAGGRPPAGSQTAASPMTAGRALRILTDNAALYAEGLLSDDEAREVEMAYSVASQPRPETMVDQFGASTTRYTRPDLAESVVDLYQQGLRRRRTGTTEEAEPAPVTAPVPTDLDIAAVRSPIDTPAASVTYPFSQSYSSDLPTLWNSSDAAAITSRIGVFAEKLPLIGPFLVTAESAKDTQQKTIIDVVTNVMTNAFQSDEGRLTVDERRDIQMKLDLLKSTIDTPTAFRDRLLGIDDALQTMFVAARAQRNNPDASPPQREAAARRMAEIHEVRTYIGAPLHANNSGLIQDPSTGTIRFEDPRLLEIVTRYPEGTTVLMGQTGKYLNITPELKELTAGMITQRRQGAQ
jgi:hypothetical protein